MPPEARKYVVTGPFEVLGHKPGEEFEGPLPEWVNEEALLESGVVQYDKGPQPRVSCPACAAEGKKKAVTFPNLGDLEAHYREKHPALEPPGAEEV